MVGKIIFGVAVILTFGLYCCVRVGGSGGSPDGRNVAKEKEGSGKWRKRIREIRRGQTFGV